MHSGAGTTRKKTARPGTARHGTARRNAARQGRPGTTPAVGGTTPGEQYVNWTFAGVTRSSYVLLPKTPKPLRNIKANLIKFNSVQRISVLLYLRFNLPVVQDILKEYDFGHSHVENQTTKGLVSASYSSSGIMQQLMNLCGVNESQLVSAEDFC
jgi:hypothetical protein